MDGGRLRVRVVAFDLGETLADETRLWESWADWLGVPHFDLLALLGATVARGRHHREALRLLRPDVDVDVETERRRAAGIPEWPSEADLYPDALACLARLRGAGFRVGVAGNQSAEEEAVVVAFGLPVDFVGSSASWGAEKPSPEFFRRLIDAAGYPPHEIAYVGDRLDNDVRPAAQAGLRTVFLRRGPWAWIHVGRAEPPEPDLTIESLDELPDCLDPFGGPDDG